MCALNLLVLCLLISYSFQATLNVDILNVTSGYSPSQATITKGDTIKWKNFDSISHTVTSDSGAFNSSDIKAGATWQVLFSQ
jgi:plastocyanin